MLCRLYDIPSGKPNDRQLNLPKPTEVVDTTLRFGPAEKRRRVNVSCRDNLKEKSGIDRSRRILRQSIKDVSVSFIIGAREFCKQSQPCR